MIISWLLVLKCPYLAYIIINESSNILVDVGKSWDSFFIICLFSTFLCEFVWFLLFFF